MLTGMSRMRVNGICQHSSLASSLQTSQSNEKKKTYLNNNKLMFPIVNVRENTLIKVKIFLLISVNSDNIQILSIFPCPKIWGEKTKKRGAVCSSSTI